MTSFLRLLSIALFSSLLLISCKQQEGKTLEVTATGQQANAKVPINTAFTLPGTVVYRGKSQLLSSWKVISAPDGAVVVFSPPSVLGGATSQPSTSLTFSTPGTYVIRLTVQEVTGNISASSDVTLVAIAASTG